MAEREFGTAEVFGPFWRAANARTQDAAGMRLVLESGELWGHAPAYSWLPAVQAFLGPLPEDRRGFESRPDAAGPSIRIHRFLALTARSDRACRGRRG